MMLGGGNDVDEAQDRDDDWTVRSVLIDDTDQCSTVRFAPLPSLNPQYRR